MGISVSLFELLINLTLPAAVVTGVVFADCDFCLADFYFGGWDGRSRMAGIDTKKCPVYMLTGEYDWSNTPAMSQATCDKIPGGKHEAMAGLGHFPATENPKKFVPYCKFFVARLCVWVELVNEC